MLSPVLQIAVLVMVSIASVTDLRGQRVPNWLTGGGILLALALQTYLAGTAGLVHGIGGMLAGFGLLIVFYAIGGMGAGDVKLMAAVGAYVGAKTVVGVFLITGIAGGFYALALWALPEIARSGARETIKNAATGAKTVALTGQVSGVLPSRDSAPKLCYALCIAIGVIVVLAFGGVPGTRLVSPAAV
jgi:prepilin peptidase CpaA